jgi:TolA-binding protein
MRPLLALLLLLLAAPAGAQVETREGIYLQNQILQLRQALEVQRGGMAPPARGAAGGELVGALLERVNRLEEELRLMRGRVDELDYRNRALGQQLEKLQGDLDWRMQQLEGGGGRAPRAAPERSGAAEPPPAAITAPPLAATAPRTPERILAEGQTALTRRDYEGAESAAREVLSARGTARAYDARFLLADALAGQRDWQQAAVTYGEAFKASPKGTRAPEALIGFGTALNNMGQKKDACDAFAVATQQFPSLKGSLKDRLDAGRQRAGCR